MMALSTACSHRPSGRLLEGDELGHDFGLAMFGGDGKRGIAGKGMAFFGNGTGLKQGGQCFISTFFGRVEQRFAGAGKFAIDVLDAFKCQPDGIRIVGFDGSNQGFGHG